MNLSSFVSRCEAAFGLKRTEPFKLTSEREYKYGSKEATTLAATSWLELDGWFLEKYEDVFFDLDGPTFGYFVPGIMKVSLERPEYTSQIPAWLIYRAVRRTFDAMTKENAETLSDQAAFLSALTRDQLNLVREWCIHMIETDKADEITSEMTEIVFSRLVS